MYKRNSEVFKAFPETGCYPKAQLHPSQGDKQNAQWWQSRGMQLRYEPTSLSDAYRQVGKGRSLRCHRVGQGAEAKLMLGLEGHM